MSTELAQIAPAGALTPALNPAQMMEQYDGYKQWVSSALRKGDDLMVLPGTTKPFVTQSGIDRLCMGFGLATTAEVIEAQVDHNRENRYDAGRWVTIADPGRAEKDRLKALHPGRYRSKKTPAGAWEWQERVAEEGVSYGLYRYVVRVRVVLRATGELLGEGLGICSSMETRYVRAPQDAEHTVLAMAQKRAKARAVLSVLGLTSMFGSDQPVDVPGEETAAPSEPRSSKWSGSANEGQNSATDGRPAPGQVIVGMAVLLRNWSTTAGEKADLEALAQEKGLKLVTAIAKAQEGEDGPANVETQEAFAAWLRQLEVQG